MVTKDWSATKTRLADFFKNNHINQIITFSIIVCGLYISLISITGQNVAHPLSPVTSKTLDLTRAADEILHSIISCFMLVVLAIAAGKLVKFLYIPSLIGCMAVGIAMRNIPQLGDLFYINDYWQFILRKLALVVIIIRWGISINIKFIKKNYTFPPLLGIGSATTEALSIFFTAHFLFNFPLSLSLICGFVVATVSPAISGPTMGHLREKSIGTEKNIPDIVPAACCFDNVWSLLIFSLTASATFTTESVGPTMIKSIGAIVLAVVFGCILGWIIRWFPKNDNKHTHIARFLIIASSTYGVITSMIVLGYQFPGIVAGLSLCCVAATHWREDNPRGIKVLVHQYDNLWYFLAVPLLFSLVGYTFDFSEITRKDLQIAISLVCIGVVARFISAMFISFLGGFTICEQIILSLSLMPKATVQCALAPSLILLTDNFPELEDTTKLVINTCIIAVMITSPIVEILLDILAPRILKKSLIFNSALPSETTVTTSTDNYTVPQFSAPQLNNPNGLPNIPYYYYNKNEMVSSHIMIVNGEHNKPSGSVQKFQEELEIQRSMRNAAIIDHHYEPVS
ncbi:unnamed protein product [Caenorhabditis angaria]|uniref:Cation/H+ exchanger transmembrane domain-containing protein n=1 Tax=Caenorhabditis angaria TaxID=860376 RepID=A0A9P1N961_9PELO|nr:unnamed protein product [Caenorhabditis angaria]